MLGKRQILLFVHQLPKRSSTLLRGRVTRRLHDLLALPLKPGVYVVKDSARARRELEAMATDVQTGGGYASVFLAEHLNREPEVHTIQELA
jgi:hypothetical protein